MCFTYSRVRTAGPWNWDGDEIINPPVLEGARKVPGTKSTYAIDIRSFVLSLDNAVLAEAVRRMLDRLPVGKREFFRSTKPGSFDFRVQTVMEFMGRETRYIPSQRRSFDSWLFPDETLRKGGGDCEDRAFLLAALLRAAGVSGYAVRVVLGKLYAVETGADSGESRDHVWVMYRNEAGRWMCLEPLLLTEEAARKGDSLACLPRRPAIPSYEYVPYYAFNDAHLWHIRSNIRPPTPFSTIVEWRKFWRHYDPVYAAGVHDHIFDRALPELPWTDRQFMKSVSLAMDAWAPGYDPCEHFDNGYIRESWQLAMSRLAFGTLTGLAQAAHAVADFYAHTSYASFANLVDGRLPLFDGKTPAGWKATYDRGDFDLMDVSRFSVNEHYHRGIDREEAVRECRKRRIISGRYAQPGDQAQSFLERTFVAIPYVLRKAHDFPARGLFPHHDEIAVDAPPEGNTIPPRHAVYRSVEDYRRQFTLRFDAAVRHVHALYEHWIES
ncbi:MAG: transglutaminase domain-containing protein [Bacteroidota bacterium]|nr:transglutaminase domain-containing protein [Bacteroidota bacterium]